MITRQDQNKFNENPSLFLEEKIKNYAKGSPNNRLSAYGGEPLFEEPFIGFADGDDPIFQDFKKDIMVGEFHLTPREALSLYLLRQDKKNKIKQPRYISIISAVFPFTRSIRKSNRDESLVGSAKWNAAHHAGFAFVEECLQSVSNLLEELEYVSVVPSYTKPLVEIMSIHGITSDWSEKHIAYAAGLGTFSLNGGLITSKGKAVCICSLITELNLPATPRTYKKYTDYCIFYQDGSCKRCINRCPSGAISENGYDAAKCFNYNSKSLSAIIKESGREGYPDDHIICGLCETMVPCEDRIPAKIKL